jgi:hypothetical protein
LLHFQKFQQAPEDSTQEKGEIAPRQRKTRPRFEILSLDSSQIPLDQSAKTALFSCRKITPEWKKTRIDD